jgi:microcystin-dependent protein
VANPFLAEIRIFPFNFAPIGWALCDGQLLPISQNTALFSLLGTNYGGNGTSTFGLPSLQGRVAMHPEQGPGLSPHDLGEDGGSDEITLLQSQIAAHNHDLQAAAQNALQTLPGPGNLLARSSGAFAYQENTSSNLVEMSAHAIAPAGGNQPHNNLQPYLTLNFCIALTGIFPARS